MDDYAVEAGGQTVLSDLFVARVQSLRADDVEAFTHYLTTRATAFWPYPEATVPDCRLSDAQLEHRITRLAQDGLATPVGEPCWARFWIARADDGQIVGHVSLRFRRQRAMAHRARLEISVLPEFRIRGLGYDLLRNALRWAEQCSRLDWIDVNCPSTHIAALRLLARAGFQEIGRVPDLFREGGRRIDTVALTRRLRRSS